MTLETTGLEFHTGPKSVNAYYQENSYGQDSLGGKVLGPFDYSMSDCGTTATALRLGRVIDTNTSPGRTH